MITKFTIKNFKKLESATLDLGNAVVFIGPNNSGKTSALQALTLWDLGWRKWVEKRDSSKASERSGVTINRKDLNTVPVPSAKLLWSELRTQDNKINEGKQTTEKVLIQLVAEGVHQDKPWLCSMDFYYANEESFYCRLNEDSGLRVPEGARQQQIVFIPSMSGLAGQEFRKELGEINFHIGEGRTAEVLRNLCWLLYSKEQGEGWKLLREKVAELFGVQLNDPIYIKERSLITLSYGEKSGAVLDISASGRGFQQVLLILCAVLSNPQSIILLDEPDAHLEILRQRDVYNLLTGLAEKQNSQIIAASHSEVVLQEAADRDVVVAFIGKPHRIDVRSRNQVRKSLESIRMSDYYLAEQKGWMIYLEGSTDLAILRRFADRLNHPSKIYLSEGTPAIYLGNNQPQGARDHFWGLKEAKSDLVGVAIFDRLKKELDKNPVLVEKMWRKREIENYITSKASILALIEQGLIEGDLVDDAERKTRRSIMEQWIDELVNALKIAKRPDPWGSDIKVTDDFLDPLFSTYYERLGTPQQIFKRDYHGLTDFIPLKEIDPEVVEVLDLIFKVASRATPRK